VHREGLRKHTAVCMLFSMGQQVFTEATDLFCLSQVDVMALLAGVPWSRYAVIGDSLSAGTGDPSPDHRGQGWSDRVAGVLRSVRPELEYLNVSESEHFGRCTAWRTRPAPC